MYQRNDGLIFVYAIISFGIFLLLVFKIFPFGKQFDKQSYLELYQVKEKCRMHIPQITGDWCQKRDKKGNIYYVSEDGSHAFYIDKNGRCKSVSGKIGR